VSQYLAGCLLHVNLRDALKGTLARKPESLPEVEAERHESSQILRMGWQKKTS